jgi:uncharacterized tellurite resistance protein B-like protein
LASGLAVLLWVTWAFARAGGGQHYSGGSFSHSSSSSSSSSSDDGGIVGAILGFVIQLIIEVLWDLTLEYPHVMVPIWLGLLLILAVWQYRSSDSTTSRAVARQSTVPEPTPEERHVELTEVKVADPDFSEARFLAQARATFVAVQEAWVARTLPQVRAMVSDGVLQRFQAQQALMAIEGVRNVLADLTVLDARVHDLTRTASAEIIDVRFEASARDADVPVDMADAEALRRAGAMGAERFTEVWTFIRMPGVKTKEGAAVRGTCPSCGAVYQRTGAGQCEFCKAVLNSGQHDWVLAEITQPEEYRPHTEVKGAALLATRDPDFNPFVLEDRASLVFWKLLLERAAVDGKGLAQVVTPTLRASEEVGLAALRAAHQRRSYAQAAVGGVDLLSVELAADGEGDDRACARIRWSARTVTLAEGKRATGLEQTAHFTDVLTLVRSSKARTLSARGLATSRCNVCGGVATDADLTACAFCGTELGPSRADWVGLSLENHEVWRARQAPSTGASAGERAAPEEAFLPQSERERLLQTLVALARADQIVTPREDQMLRRYSKRWNVPAARVTQWLAAPQPPAVALPAPGSPAAGAFLITLVRMALADGTVDRNERRLLDTVAQDLALAPSAVDRAIDELKAVRT